MAISNELSSEVATALLAAKDKSPEELTDLKSLVLQIHSTLRQMELEAREEQNRIKPDDPTASDR